MNRVLAVGIIDLSDDVIEVMLENGINSLRELMVQRDMGFINSERFYREVLRELLSACQKIVSQKRQVKPTHAGNSTVYDDGRRHIYESIKKDLISVGNHERPTSIRKAVLKLLSESPYKGFDRKTIKNILERRYGKWMSVNTDTLRSTLSSLKSHGFIIEMNELGLYRFNKSLLELDSRKPGSKNSGSNEFATVLAKMENLRCFIDRNVGREIEFRYKTARSGSEKRWRRTVVRGQNDWYMYTDDCYPSGRGVQYVKEKIIEYREVK